MKVNRRARLAQKRRWRPRLSDIVHKAIQKNMPLVIANITRNNALFRRLIGE